MAQPRAVAIHALEQHFPVRVRLASTLTDDELLEFCARNRDLRIERTAEGEIIVMPPAGSETGRRNFELTLQLGKWVEQDRTGVGFDSSTGFILPNGAERAPDAAWVRRERWEALPRAQREKFAPLCPDFVVELRSPSDALPILHAKLEEYIACGALLGWLIDPFTPRAWIYRPGRAVEVIEGPATLSGDPELPGLRLDLAALA